MNRNQPYISALRKRVKEISIQSMGGCCQICKYNRCHQALEFHHIDEKEKEIGIGSGHTWSYSKIRIELKKCILLCCLCHREVHFNDLSLPEEYATFNEELFDQLRLAHQEKINRGHSDRAKSKKRNKGIFIL